MQPLTLPPVSQGGAWQPDGFSGTTVSRGFDAVWFSQINNNPSVSEIAKGSWEFDYTNYCQQYVFVGVGGAAPWSSNFAALSTTPLSFIYSFDTYLPPLTGIDYHLTYTFVAEQVQGSAVNMNVYNYVEPAYEGWEFVLDDDSVVTDLYRKTANKTNFKVILKTFSVPPPSGGGGVPIGT